MRTNKPTRPPGGEGIHSHYLVFPLNTPPLLDTVWDGRPWKDIPALGVSRHMGEKPVHLPMVQAKVAYEVAAISVIFRVEDRYVRAVARNYQDNVYEDSCVEFFFTPGRDISIGYFNLEINCGGTALFDFHPGHGKVVHIAAADFSDIQIAHTLPARVDPEITTPITWVLEYRIPFDVIGKYCEATRPVRGDTWKANFYKCGDKTSHPHWLTWSRVDYPSPQFHLPAFFGSLEFT